MIVIIVPNFYKCNNNQASKRIQLGTNAITIATTYTFTAAIITVSVKVIAIIVPNFYKCNNNQASKRIQLETNAMTIAPTYTFAHLRLQPNTAKDQKPK